jgi:hypothetical protein
MLDSLHPLSTDLSPGFNGDFQRAFEYYSKMRVRTEIDDALLSSITGFTHKDLLEVVPEGAFCIGSKIRYLALVISRLTFEPYRWMCGIRDETYQDPFHCLISGVKQSDLDIVCGRHDVPVRATETLSSSYQGMIYFHLDHENGPIDYHVYPGFAGLNDPEKLFLTAMPSIFHTLMLKREGDSFFLEDPFDVLGLVVRNGKRLIFDASADAVNPLMLEALPLFPPLYRMFRVISACLHEAGRLDRRGPKQTLRKFQAVMSDSHLDEIESELRSDPSVWGSYSRYLIHLTKAKVFNWELGMMNLNEVNVRLRKLFDDLIYSDYRKTLPPLTDNY